MINHFTLNTPLSTLPMFNVQPSPYDISFRVWGFPVSIHPLFWLVMFLIGMRPITNMRTWVLETVAWLLAAFVAILVHELGHALAFRHLYRMPSRIVLYGFGGVTYPLSNYSRRLGFWGTAHAVLLSFAGPLAGFVLAGILIVISFLKFSDIHSFVMATNIQEYGVSALLWQTVSSIIIVSIFWGILNLLPIYPMDGGQIVREIFFHISPRSGIANSLALSMIAAICCAILAFTYGHLFGTFLAGYFVYNNYSELTCRNQGYR